MGSAYTRVQVYEKVSERCVYEERTVMERAGENPETALLRRVLLLTVRPAMDVWRMTTVGIVRGWQDHS